MKKNLILLYVILISIAFCGCKPSMKTTSELSQESDYKNNNQENETNNNTKNNEQLTSDQNVLGNVNDNNIKNKVEINANTVDDIKIEELEIDDKEGDRLYNYSKYIKLTCENPLLQKALDKLNEKYELDAKNHIQEYRQEVRDFCKEINDENMMFSLNIDANIIRNDDKYLVLSVMDSVYLGGAHGTYYESGINIDKKSGKILELDDIIEHKNDLYNYIKKYLKEHDDGDYMPDYEQCIDMYKTGDNDAKLQFLIDKDSVKVIFQIYDIKPYASGITYVPIDKNLMANEK